MSEPQFTPGPWSLKAGSESKIVSINGKKVATADLQECLPYDPWGQPRGRFAATPERKANAALIAAAPDGYEYAETTAEVLRLLLETYKLPEQARKCLQDRIDESEKYRKKARGEA